MRSVTFAAGLLLALGGCASIETPAPINAPLAAPPPPRGDDPLGINGDALVLSLSGGGARASAFSYGVLLGLRDMPAAQGGRLIDRVALVTSVSGGSITAAYFGQHGADGLDGFRKAGLDADWYKAINSSPAAPGNWFRLLGGGINGKKQISTWLDGHVFDGATLADMKASPRVVLNATELYTGAPFAFTRFYLDPICSDLGAIKIADAVNASMAVPIAIRTVPVQSYAANCPAPPWIARAASDRAAPVLLRQTARAFEMYRDPARAKYLHLSDGGVVDNFGLASLIAMRQAATTPYGPFSPEDAVRAHRVTFVVVNSEQLPMGDWLLTTHGPKGADAIRATLNDSIAANSNGYYQAFAVVIGDWQRDLVAYRCGLSTSERKALGLGADWKCADLHFNLDMISFTDVPAPLGQRLGEAPTRVSLDRELVDDLIKAGREAVQANATVRALQTR